MIARIAVSTVNFAADKSYSYRVPQDMTLSPGSRVVIPFGRGNRLVEGIVLGVESGCEDKLKAVARCLDGTPLLTEQMLRLSI